MSGTIRHIKYKPPNETGKKKKSSRDPDFDPGKEFWDEEEEEIQSHLVCCLLLEWRKF